MKIDAISQIGLVVKDADKMFGLFERYFGADRNLLDVSDTRDPGLRCKDITVHGKPQCYGARFLCFPLASIEIELIQPLDDIGPYAEFLAEHGEGIHHLKLEVDDIPAFSQVMEAVNAPMISGGHSESTRYQYFDARNTVGAILEICQRKPFEEA